MLLDHNNTKIQITCQQYECTNYELDETKKEIWLDFHSRQTTENVRCMYCGADNVEIHDNSTTVLKDMPVFYGFRQFVRVRRHKYKCRFCRKVFSEEICFKETNTRVTTRAANFIRAFLSMGMPASTISECTGIHWETVRNIHTQIMDETLQTRFRKLKEDGYRPEYLAVDEFAIHKGQTYATSVMDLDSGEVLWVGRGRSTEDFKKFFQEYDMDLLKEVKAVAMDMNTAFRNLFEKYIPQAEIVLDRFHVQSLYSTRVLNAVRVAEAKQYLRYGRCFKKFWKDETTKSLRSELKQQFTEEHEKYIAIRDSRWAVLTNSKNLSATQKTALETILEDHKDLAVCYAMREEMTRLFELRDPEKATKGWKKWFKAAAKSRIKPLVNFAKAHCEKIDYLASHASHPISTAKLEGLNNKIKVAKRIGYGFRNDNYFFTLVRYLSLPHKYMLIPQKT